MKKRVLAGILAAGLIVSLSVFTYSEAVVSRSTALKTSVVNDTNAKKIVRDFYTKTKQLEPELKDLVDKYEKTKNKRLSSAKESMNTLKNINYVLSSNKLSDDDKLKFITQIGILAKNDAEGTGGVIGDNADKASGNGDDFWTDIWKRLQWHLMFNGDPAVGTLGGYAQMVAWNLSMGNDPNFDPWNGLRGTDPWGNYHPGTGGGGGISNGGSSGGGSGGSSGGGNYQPSPDVWKLSAGGNNCKLVAGKCLGSGCTYTRYEQGMFQTADTITNACPSSCICPNELK